MLLRPGLKHATYFGRGIRANIDPHSGGDRHGGHHNVVGRPVREPKDRRPDEGKPGSRVSNLITFWRLRAVRAAVGRGRTWRRQRTEDREWADQGAEPATRSLSAVSRRLIPSNSAGSVWTRAFGVRPSFSTCYPKVVSKTGTIYNSSLTMQMSQSTKALSCLDERPVRRWCTRTTGVSLLLNFLLIVIEFVYGQPGCKLGGGGIDKAKCRRQPGRMSEVLVLADNTSLSF